MRQKKQSSVFESLLSQSVSIKTPKIAKKSRDPAENQAKNQAYNQALPTTVKKTQDFTTQYFQTTFQSTQLQNPKTKGGDTPPQNIQESRKTEPQPETCNRTNWKTKKPGHESNRDGNCGFSPLKN